MIVLVASSATSQRPFHETRRVGSRLAGFPVTDGLCVMSQLDLADVAIPGDVAGPLWWICTLASCLRACLQAWQLPVTTAFFSQAQQQGRGLPPLPNGNRTAVRTEEQDESGLGFSGIVEIVVILFIGMAMKC